MNMIHAIQKRHSNRAYLNTPLKENVVEKLQWLIEEYNSCTGLHMQLILHERTMFRNMRKSYGLFQNVQHYIAMVGPNGEEAQERIGYWGEKLVLEATLMGLGTCWVGDTFDKIRCQCAVNSDETLYCVIVFGNVANAFSLREKLISKLIHREAKSLEQLCTVEETAPEWFWKGMDSVLKAPSARNQQPVFFSYTNRGVLADIKERTQFHFIALGIAKLHFEIGAGGGNWTMGGPGMFTK